MPRPVKPLQIIDNEGKYRLTRAERERREKSEVKIGSKKLRVPADIKDNHIARKKFLELVRIYDGCNFVSSSDVDILAEYCKLFAEIIDYEGQMKDIAITDDQFLKLDSRLDRKRDLLVKLQDRIFLNPAAKIKNVPQPEAQQSSSPMAQFFSKKRQREMDEAAR